MDSKPSTDSSEALRGLVDLRFVKSDKWREQQARPVRVLRRDKGVDFGAHPDILQFSRLFVNQAAKRGIPIWPSDIIRTPERQAELYALGHSKAKPGQSPHQYGCAVDLVHGVHGWNLDRRQWQLLGHIGKELAAARGFKLVWGGDWKFYDPAHWELEFWRAVKEDFPWRHV